MPYAIEKHQPAIYYETVGNGTPILFIPPPGVGHLTFHYQANLSDVCKVVTFDIRGDCRSGRSKERVTMMQLAYDVKRVLDTNQIDKAIICGYSNGASIAQEFALTYPQRTTGIILIGGYFEVRSFLLKKEYQIGIWTAKNERMTLLAAALAKNHFSDNRAAKQLYREVLKTDPQMLANQYQAGLYYSSIDRLHRIQVPLLLMYGSRDYYIHSYQDRFQQIVHDTEVVYIQGTKHQVPTKSPEACNAVISLWLRRKGFI